MGLSGRIGKGGKPHETNAHESEYGERNSRSGEIAKRASTPGSDRTVDQPSHEPSPDAKKAAQKEKDWLPDSAEDTLVEPQSARRAIAGDAYVKPSTLSETAHEISRNSGLGFLKFFREAQELAAVVDVASRKTEANDIGPAVEDLIHHPDGTVSIIQRGQAEFVDMATVKKEIDQIEAKIPWGETYDRAVRRMASNLEPTLFKDHHKNIKETLEKEHKDALDWSKVKKEFQDQGKTEFEASSLARKAVSQKAEQIDKLATGQAKSKAKEEARKKAVEWYKNASKDRRDSADALLKELLPDQIEKISKKHLKADSQWVEHVARVEAEREAKTEWDADIKKAKEDLAVVVDTNFPGATYDYLRTVDHHGVFSWKADGSPQKANATMQMANNAEDALRAAGVKDLRNPTDVQVLKAVELWNLKQATTNSVGDGMMAVWISKNQIAFLKSAILKSEIRMATRFEDFTAFSRDLYDRNDPGVELQAALFHHYDRILREHEVFGSDVMPPEKATAIVNDLMPLMDRVIFDPQFRSESAGHFWEGVDGAQVIAEGAVTHEVKVDGRTVGKVYDLSKLSEFGIFAQWVAIPASSRPKPMTHPDGTLKLDAQGFPIMSTPDAIDFQVTESPQPVTADQPSRSLVYDAIPFGNKLGGKDGLLPVLPDLNKAEPKNFWFGKPNVVLADPKGGGSQLGGKAVAEMTADRLYRQKAPEPALEGRGNKLITMAGQEILPLNSAYAAEIPSVGARQIYLEASKLIENYGVGKNYIPKAKGERLAELAESGDVRAKEALNLLREMKTRGDTLERSGDHEGLKSASARFKVLITELGGALEGKSSVSPELRVALKAKATEASAEYQGHRRFAKNPADGTKVDAYNFAEAEKVQGNEVQKRAANQVLEAAETNAKILGDKGRGEISELELLEKALRDPNGFRDPAERTLAEKTVEDLYGVLDRNLKLIERWKNYKSERIEFNAQIAEFEAPYITAVAKDRTHLVDSKAPDGVVDVSTDAPEYYEDLGSLGRKPGDYASTIWVKTPTDQIKILGDLWSQRAKQDPNRVKWGRDAQGRFLRLFDVKGRQFDVHVAVAPTAKADSKPTVLRSRTTGATVGKPDAIPYDLAAKRASRAPRNPDLAATNPGIK